MGDDHPSWPGHDGQLRVEPQALGEFAERVMGELLSAFGDSRSRVDPILTESLTVPYGGGGLMEGEAFARAHAVTVLALGDFLSDVGKGMLTLGMGAGNISTEYANADAESAAMIASVRRTFAPALAYEAEAAERVEAWARTTYDTGRPGAAEGAGPDEAEAAQEADEDRYRQRFEERVQERLEQFEDRGTDSAGFGGMGDLGPGRESHEVLGGPDPDNPEVLIVTPADDEGVAQTPPESLAAVLEAERRDG